MKGWTCTCSLLKKAQNNIQDFGGETSWKIATFKTKKEMGG